MAGGTLDTFEAYVWSMKTGQMLTTLTGHTAPISSLAFNPDMSSLGIELSSVGWDSNLRIWDITGDDMDDGNLSSTGLTKEVVNFGVDGKLILIFLKNKLMDYLVLFILFKKFFKNIDIMQLYITKCFISSFFGKH